MDMCHNKRNAEAPKTLILLLPYAVKTLTGNTELIQMLNRLGHGVSYSQLQENDTAVCLQKLTATQNQNVVLPTPLQPSIFTSLAWDYRFCN